MWRKRNKDHRQRVNNTEASDVFKVDRQIETLCSSRDESLPADIDNFYDLALQTRLNGTLVKCA